VIGAAVGTALLPMLSRQVRSGEAAAARDTLNRAMEYALFLTLPAALALMVVPTPVMAVLFGRGAFDAESVRLSAQSLAAYALGLPAFVLVKVLAPGFFARGDTATPVKVSVAVIVLNFSLNLAFMRPLEHIGPALASSISASVNVICLALLLWRRGQWLPDARFVRAVLRMAGAAAAMACTLWLANIIVYQPLDGPHGLRWVGLSLLIAIGLAAYFGVGQAIGAFDVREVLAMLRRRRAAVIKNA
jgi:putative peptidoglycan lipid II flippase